MNERMGPNESQPMLARLTVYKGPIVPTKAEQHWGGLLLGDGQTKRKSTTYRKNITLASSGWDLQTLCS